MEDNTTINILQIFLPLHGNWSLDKDGIKIKNWKEISLKVFGACQHCYPSYPNCQQTRPQRSGAKSRWQKNSWLYFNLYFLDIFPKENPYEIYWNVFRNRKIRSINLRLGKKKECQEQEIGTEVVIGAESDTDGEPDFQIVFETDNQKAAAEYTGEGRVTDNQLSAFKALLLVIF